MGELNLVIGPMYSGKSTELLRIYNKYKRVGRNNSRTPPKFDLNIRRRMNQPHSLRMNFTPQCGAR